MFWGLFSLSLSLSIYISLRFYVIDQLNHFSDCYYKVGYNVVSLFCLHTDPCVFPYFLRNEFMQRTSLDKKLATWDIFLAPLIKASKCRVKGSILDLNKI